jgi:hypothetical protein
MTPDRRSSDRRGSRSTVSLGAVLEEERRARRDRRDQPRRRSDLRTIAHYARYIGAPQTHCDVVVDASEGMRLMAQFPCDCVAIEPVGTGPAAVRAAPCRDHAEPAVKVDRRRRH